jgi:hypothetical protein
VPYGSECHQLEPLIRYPTNASQNRNTVLDLRRIMRLGRVPRAVPVAPPGSPSREPPLSKPDPDSCPGASLGRLFATSRPPAGQAQQSGRVGRRGRSGDSRTRSIPAIGDRAGRLPEARPPARDGWRRRRTDAMHSRPRPISPCRACDRWSDPPGLAHSLVSPLFTSLQGTVTGIEM